jgi:hypothetical protein
MLPRFAILINLTTASFCEIIITTGVVDPNIDSAGPIVAICANLIALNTLPLQNKFKSPSGKQ